MHHNSFFERYLSYSGATAGAIALLMTGVEGFAAPPSHAPGPPPHASGPPSHANQSDKAQPPLVISRQGYFYVGGEYDDPDNPTEMTGQMYVEYQIPAQKKGQLAKPPIVMIHGGAHTGAGFVSTPDGRPGLADYFLRRGWPVYVVDRPGVAKSSSVGPFGNTSTVSVAEDRWSASEKAAPSIQWPQANLHTQWPGTGIHGDPAFDQYYAHLSPSGTASGDAFRARALIALLEKIGPAVVMPHSAPGPSSWHVADMRPDLVAALVEMEPSGPPIYEAPRFGTPGGELTRPWGPSSLPLAYDPPISDPSELNIVQEAEADAPGLIPCWLQAEPARQLPRLTGVPILMVLGEASYHAPYDHCTSKWLSQAGVPHTFIRLEDIGIQGNGHIYLLEKNHFEIAKLMENWLLLALPQSPALAQENSED